MMLLSSPLLSSPIRRLRPKIGPAQRGEHAVGVGEAAVLEPVQPNRDPADTHR
jgi:hypothetical protein